MAFSRGITGLILGKPLGGREMEKVYDRVTLEVLDRLGLGSLPCCPTPAAFNSPSGIVPMGAMARLDGTRAGSNC